MRQTLRNQAITDIPESKKKKKTPKDLEPLLFNGAVQSLKSAGPLHISASKLFIQTCPASAQIPARAKPLHNVHLTFWVRPQLARTWTHSKVKIIIHIIMKKKNVLSTLQSSAHFTWPEKMSASFRLGLLHVTCPITEPGAVVLYKNKTPGSFKDEEASAVPSNKTKYH